MWGEHPLGDPHVVKGGTHTGMCDKTNLVGEASAPPPQPDTCRILPARGDGCVKKIAARGGTFPRKASGTPLAEDEASGPGSRDKALIPGTSHTVSHTGEG